ncbi:MAG: ATPase [Alphaproteobacteria bacterium]|nr:ATPase [Alphaproteobacteria bacterium]
MPDLVRRWLTGPEGWSFQTCDIDLRVGGKFHWVWVSGDGQTLTLNGAYHDIEAPGRMVHEERFDEDWATSSATVTTLFSPEAGGTLMHMTMRFIDKATRDTAFGTGMVDGMEASYARLERTALAA